MELARAGSMGSPAEVSYWCSLGLLALHALNPDPGTAHMITRGTQEISEVVQTTVPICWQCMPVSLKIKLAMSYPPVGAQREQPLAQDMWVDLASSYWHL